jgi:hypothetical protein
MTVTAVAPGPVRPVALGPETTGALRPGTGELR